MRSCHTPTIFLIIATGRFVRWPVLMGAFSLLTSMFVAGRPARAGPPSARAEPITSPVWAQRGSEGPHPPSWRGYAHPQLSLVTGLIQPIVLRGGNLEIDFYYRRLVVSYSHGFLLNLEGDTVVGSAKEQRLVFHLPYSTGASVGYRFTEWLDARLEAKGHRFEVREARDDRVVLTYSTATLGLGVYARYRPFFHVIHPGRHPTWAQGFVITTSLRFWPNIWSSLPRDQRRYANSTTGTQEVHDANNIGIANSPFIFNVSVGYLFDFSDLRRASLSREGRGSVATREAIEGQ